MDAIDIGRGLIIIGGTGGDPEGNFQDFVSADQDQVTNGRWGVVVSAAGAVIARGILQIGNGASNDTEFLDNTSVVLFPDGYHGPGLVGVLVDLSDTNNIVNIGSTLIGAGSRTTSDTRPDFVVSGTSGVGSFYGTLLNHRNVTLQSVFPVHDATVECELLTQNGAEIEDSTILTNAQSGVACIQDPTFGASAGIHDVVFEQSGSGHALEIDTAGDYTFTNIGFNGYGADTQNDAAIYVSAPSGTVTINISGGDTPTYRSAGATVVISNPIIHTLTGIVENSEVTYVRDSDEAILYHVENVGATGQVQYGYEYTGDTDVYINIFHTNYNPLSINVTLGGSDQTLPVSQELDPIYSNP
jgi:hypothetical protein